MDTGLKTAIDHAGGLRELARRLGLAHGSVQQWDRVPAERLVEIEKASGVRRDKLRPDVFVGFEEKLWTEFAQEMRTRIARFDFKDFDLKVDADLVLAAIEAALKDVPTMVVEFKGHERPRRRVNRG